jgi:hypothetical protein
MVVRRTFIVTVQGERDLLLEDVRSRRAVRLAALGEIGEQIGQWLEPRPEDAHGAGGTILGGQPIPPEDAGGA